MGIYHCFKKKKNKESVVEMDVFYPVGRAKEEVLEKTLDWKLKEQKEEENDWPRGKLKSISIDLGNFQNYFLFSK